MKLQLKKTALVNLSHDSTALPQELTPQIAGGGLAVDPQSSYVTYNCQSAQCITQQDNAQCATNNTDAWRFGMQCY